MADEKQPGSAENSSTFDIDELDDKALEAASGGGTENDQDQAMFGLNIDCDTNSNCAGGNCVAGCT